MILKQYTQSGVREYILKHPEYENDKIWLEKMITHEELTEMNELLNLNQFEIDLNSHIPNTYFAKIINKFLEEKLPSGKICSLASGLGDREHWLLQNSEKNRVFYVSDLYTNKILNKIELSINQKFNKKCFVPFKKPVNQINVPYKNNYFDGIMSVGSMDFLNNDELNKHISEMLRVLKINGTGILCYYQLITPKKIVAELIKKLFYKSKQKYFKHYAYARDLNEVKRIFLSQIDKNNLSVFKYLSKDTMVNNFFNNIPLIRKIYLMFNVGVVFFVFKKIK